ncbi:MAG: TRAP transporter large permease subunit [Deltaproteobacteria bacterium]|nr:TRAP transporter large permease subunit [Deltaproteobacteria bacterium]
MGTWELSFLGLGGMLLLMAMGMPIAFAMLLSGGIGIATIVGPQAALSMVGQLAVSVTTNYDLSVAPMFILMGAFVTRAGMSHDLYDACHAFLGHLRGGLAMATVAACGGFAAVCGSSLATAATMSKVAMPSMRRYGYKDSLAAGSIASGGTLGILIPPSVILVIYGILTGTDIGKLFIAGIIPGIMTIGMYIVAIIIITKIHPEAGPPADRVLYRERFTRLRRVTAIGILFLFIIGGIYLGVFTPTEAGGVGAFGAFVFTLCRRILTVRIFFECLLETVQTSAMLFIVLVGAIIFSNFVNLAGLPSALSDFVTQKALPPLGVMAMMILIFMVMGCFLESLSMVLLMVPIFFPIALSLGFHPVWFGIVVVMVTELSFITPPVGLNLFVLKSTIKDINMATIYRGIFPFAIADVIRISTIIWFPSIVLFLPSMGG